MEDNNDKINATVSTPDAQINAPASAIKLSLLDLNAIKLDVRHTVLTPDYLDKLAANKDNVSPADINV